MPIGYILHLSRMFTYDYHHTRAFWNFEPVKRVVAQDRLFYFLRGFNMERKVSVSVAAEMLGYEYDTIRKKVKELFPEIVENGKQTLLDMSQVTKLKGMLVPRTLALKSEVESVSTDMEMIQKAQDFMQWATIKIKEETEKRIAAEEKIQIDAPKVAFYNTVTDSKDTMEIGTVAKVLNLPYGRNTLFSILRGKNILRDNNEPYQLYIDRGYFKIVEEPYKKNGATFIGFKTVVYQKGLEYIKKVVTE